MIALAGWENFYVIVGSAAGALIGLQFVVVTLIADSPTLRVAEGFAAFATPTIVHFGVVLLLSAVVSVPWHKIGTVTVVWGFSRSQWDSIRRHRVSAYESANHLPARVRGLVVSCSASICAVMQCWPSRSRCSSPSLRTRGKGAGAGLPVRVA
jgi:hypothetical protein